jgi:FKBP-type peptidyl-prolyl cis-trans isomerase FkpA
MNRVSYVIIFILMIIFSCKPGKERRTESGMRYILYQHNEGKKPVKGDYVTVDMVYTDANDSVLYDSRIGNKPIRFQLRQSPFVGSMEEGLMELSEKDSATLFVSADSMYEKVLSKEPGNTMAKPKAGSFLKFHVKLLRVQTYDEAELDMALNESQLIKAEDKALENYLKEKNITASPETEGYYIIRQVEGKGAAIDSGAIVKINYTGRFLNGNPFDSNLQSGKPYSFTVGSGQVIKGWDLAFRKLNEGDKVTLIIPSNLAYASEGIKAPNNTTYIVPPYATLIFDIEVLGTKEIAKK